jgi:hypothetical protein
MPGKDPVMAPFVIEAGQTLSLGSVLGAITASGKLKLSDPASSDGSETPRYILAEDLDTSSGDKVFQVYVEGAFSETALVYGGAHTSDTVRVPLASQGIYLKSARYSFT